ncbi:MAG: Bug family tripartite tricarboxylate transporter substrate binding protein [Chloroflexota bacterium]
MVDPDLRQRSLTRRTFLKVGAGMVAVAGLGPLSACGPAAPAYPTKTINMIIPLAAGSAPDATFRVLAQEAEKELGQKIVIINRTGPGGTTGVAETIAAKADGYTIGMCAVAMVSVQPLMQDTPYKGPDEMTPIVQVDEAYTVVYVKADSPFKTLKDLVEEAKKRPEKVTVAVSGGPYNILHIEMALLEKLAGVKFNLVPYDSAQHVPAVLGGTVEVGIGQVALLTQHTKAGTLRALTVFGSKRAKGMEDVSLAKEQGYDITDVPYEFVMGPKGLPKEVVDKLVPAFTKAAKSDVFVAYCEKSGLVHAYEPADVLAKKLQNSAATHKALIDELGWAKKK